MRKQIDISKPQCFNYFKKLINKIKKKLLQKKKNKEYVEMIDLQIPS